MAFIVKSWIGNKPKWQKTAPVNTLAMAQAIADGVLGFFGDDAVVEVFLEDKTTKVASRIGLAYDWQVNPRDLWDRAA